MKNILCTAALLLLSAFVTAPAVSHPVLDDPAKIWEAGSEAAAHHAAAPRPVGTNCLTNAKPQDGVARLGTSCTVNSVDANGRVNGARKVSVDIPDCRPEEFLYWVIENRDDGDRLHIEVVPLKGGEIEAFDVSKPGHALYEKAYRKRGLICRAAQQPSAGG